MLGIDLEVVLYFCCVLFIILAIIAKNMIKSRDQDIQVLKSIANNNRDRVATFIRLERGELGKLYKDNKCSEEVYEFILAEQEHILRTLD